MHRKLILITSVLFTLFLFVGILFAGGSVSKKLVKFVDPMIGTGGHGHTYPGAALPYGMVQLSPDNGRGGWDWCSGYNYSDSLIAGFSHTHLSGTGIGDLCDILITPVTGKFDPSKNITIDTTYNVRSHFSHKDEKAEPGYYSVLLKDYNVKAELTTAPRCGMHKYTFPKSNESSIVLDLGFAINWDAPTETKITIEDNSTVSGYRFSKGWAQDEKIYFVIKFSKPFMNFASGNGNNLISGNKNAAGKRVKGIFGYQTSNAEKLLLKVGISYVSIEGAKNNLQKEIPGWNFESLRNAASETWERELNRVQITTANQDNKRVFYTALYHTKLAPVIFADIDGKYRGADGKIYTQNGFVNHSVFSLWDTFRALHPLMTIVDKDQVSDMVNSMVAQFDQTGSLPVWPLVGNETNCMVGIHSIPVITEAYLKGIKGFDAEAAFKAMKTSALKDGAGKQFYNEFNYIPADKEIESVSKTLEFAYDDWCVAQMAKALNKREDYALFMKRSMSYRNLFDPSSGFMRGKLADGSWKSPFDPFAVDHRNNEYTEGNAWHYIWFVLHNIPDLVQLSGGAEKFISKLDTLFTTAKGLTGENISPDISGMVGQYAQGNEPCHHVAYLYNYAGAAWKTQQQIRNILSLMYKTGPEGLPGNEDCGQMSAWYILSSIGLYPVNPASGIFDIGSPSFEKVSFKVNGGKTFEVIAKNNSSKNIYIQSASLNGKNLNDSFITYKDIMQGGKLEFNMGPEPNKSWANNVRIISDSK